MRADAAGDGAGAAGRSGLLLLALLLAPLAGCGPRPPRLELALDPRPGGAGLALMQAEPRIDRRRVALVLQRDDDPQRQMEAYIGGRAQAIVTGLGTVVTVCGVAPDRCPVIVDGIAAARGSDRQPAGAGLEVLAVEPDLLRRHGDAVLAVMEGWRQRPGDGREPAGPIRQPGLQELHELLAPDQNNLPPLLERIRRELAAAGTVPVNTPLPAADDSLLRRIVSGAAAAGP